MCCLFGNNGCCNCQPPKERCCNRVCPPVTQGARGPQGPMGPQGPIGPQGRDSTANAIYATGANASVATNAIIPLSLSASTPTTNMSVNGGAVNVLDAGTYLVSYYSSGSVTEGSYITSLYLNGNAVSGQTIAITDSAGTVSKTAIISVPANSTLALYNTSTTQATVTDASLAVVKLA